ncbi:MAG: NTP transferase domain-containing protein [Oscillospiraceae bacterium]|nr:NTP transferase domain-containing protein [Oscillospiraceae bacterium]
MIILSAGLSMRMGVFKPLLPAGGVPAVVRCAQTAEAANIGEVIVVTGHLHEDIENALRALAPGARTVYNSRYREGMFSSVHAGVSALQDGFDGFFILPADCCAVSPETPAVLAEHFAKNGGKAVIRPKFEGRRGHPPLIPAGFAGALCSYDGKNGLKGFLSPLPTVEVEMDNPGPLLDMDAPEDYAAMLEYLGLPGYPTVAQCAELLTKYSVPGKIIEHGQQVAKLALELAGRSKGGGLSKLNPDLLESACLLHDIRRTEPDHARAGMELLLREGFPKAAVLVRDHMDLPSGPAHDIGELELLYLADKLCSSGKIVTLEERLREMEARLSANPEALAAAKKRLFHAQTIMDVLM